MNDEAVKLRRARLAVVRYVSLAVLTYVAGWLDQSGDVSLSDVKWNQWATLVIGVATSALVALGAVLNSAYSQVGPQAGTPGQKLGDIVKVSTPIAVLFILLMFVVSARSQSLNKPLQSVDTIADLVARTPVTNERLLVSGYRTYGDWGAQRVFRHDPSSVASTNLGCVFDNAGPGRYLAEDCDSGEVYVTWFGADPTGVLASGEAIQEAMTNGAGVINFGRGTYLIDQTLSPGNHTVLKGQTRAMAGLFPTDYPTQLKSAPGLDAPILRSNGEEFTIDGIAFNGDRTTQTGFTGTALVELLGGNNFIETFLSEIYISDSKTNALYINRTEVRIENCKIVWNDGDGILIGVGESDVDPVVVDFPIRDIQVGFNRGYGINARRAFNIRMIGADIYQNNLGGLRLANSSLFRGFGLQLDKNGGHGFSMESNCRWIHVLTGIIYDANWQIFNNYYDATPEETNSAPEGAFSNVYISTTGVKESILFEAVHFAINEGAGYSGLTRPGYEFHDARSNAGEGVTLINPIFSASTNHYAYGMMGGVSFTNLATIISAKYWGDGSRDTTLLNDVNRMTIRDTFYEWPLTVQVAATNLAHAPIAGFWRNNAETWSTYNPVTSEMQLGSLQFAGMAGTNALGWRTPLAIEASAIYDWTTNYNPAFLRFRIANDDETTLGVQAAVLNKGRFFLTPQSSAPTNYPGQGQLYFNETTGINQYLGSGWQLPGADVYLPLTGGTLRGPEIISITPFNPWPFYVRGNSSSAAQMPTIGLWRNAGISDTNYAALRFGDYIGRLGFVGLSAASSGGWIQGAYIDSIATDAWATNSTPSELWLAVTKPGTNSAVVQMKILDDGRIELTPQVSDPTNRVSNGQIYYNSASGKFRGRAGGAWVDLH